MCVLFTTETVFVLITLKRKQLQYHTSTVTFILCKDYLLKVLFVNLVIIKSDKSLSPPFFPPNIGRRLFGELTKYGLNFI